MRIIVDKRWDKDGAGARVGSTYIERECENESDCENERQCEDERECENERECEDERECENQNLKIMDNAK